MKGSVSREESVQGHRMAWKWEILGLVELFLELERKLFVVVAVHVHGHGHRDGRLGRMAVSWDPRCHWERVGTVDP